ncbi:hypothetical protein KFZ70_12705 [Tamlana fucoidanivorans]|uniref:Fibronectin type-III domain-containing protein n=1 Tax=Allotamlana fucoidanivorans TaxID=2583814 RepID=A0A5C4SDP9_9FLAO|nr:hypothetical protein [Tamlana fucoidanivorans]TNJ41535.1 hypothetical protein FGF67_15785 [Tamlana fucoidanivorans]
MMKFLKYTFGLSIIISLAIACSGGSDDGGSPPEPKNNAPFKVTSLTFPENDMLCTSNTVEFTWDAATDPDGDKVSYILEISKDSGFGAIDQSVNSNTSSKSVSLEKGIIYFWRVKVKDTKGLESEYSSVFRFYTEGEPLTNHIPFPAQPINPADGETINGNSITLEWEATDIDNDPLTYDVYVDTVNPPTQKIGDNQSNNTTNVNLNPASTYYWKIVTKDDKDGQSIGQVWSFMTN